MADLNIAGDNDYQKQEESKKLTDPAEIKGFLVDILKDAEESKKKGDVPEAINKLKKAKDYVNQLQVDKQGSVANQTVSDSNVAVLYLQKRIHILYQIQSFGEAVETCKELIASLNQDCRVDKMLGDCYRKNGEYQQAIDAYDKGLEKWAKGKVKFPYHKAGILNSMGLVYLKQKKAQEAVDAFSSAVKIKKNPLYLCNQGYALYENNQEAESIQAMREAKKVLGEISEADIAQSGLTQENIKYIKEKLDSSLAFLTEVESLGDEELTKKFQELFFISLKGMDEHDGSHITVEQMNKLQADMKATEEKGEKKKLIEALLATVKKEEVPPPQAAPANNNAEKPKGAAPPAAGGDKKSGACELI